MLLSQHWLLMAAPHLATAALSWNQGLPTLWLPVLFFQADVIPLSLHPALFSPAPLDTWHGTSTINSPMKRKPRFHTHKLSGSDAITSLLTCWPFEMDEAEGWGWGRLDWKGRCKASFSLQSLYGFPLNTASVRCGSHRRDVNKHRMNANNSMSHT